MGKPNVQDLNPAAQEIIDIMKGATTTSGAADWNDESNLTPGILPNMLNAANANGPQEGIPLVRWYHVWNIHYGSDQDPATSNLTQIAISYRSYGAITGRSQMWMRNRYNGTWSTWTSINAGVFEGTGTIPTTGWNASGSAYAYSCVVTVDDMKSGYDPRIIIDRDDHPIAQAAELCPTAITSNGTITFYANNVPTDTIAFTWKEVN